MGMKGPPLTERVAGEDGANFPCGTFTTNKHTSDLHLNHQPHRPRFILSFEHLCSANHLLTISTCRGSKLGGAEDGTANWIFFLSLGSTSTWVGTEASMSLDPEESDSQWKGEVTGKDHCTSLEDPPTTEWSHS